MASETIRRNDMTVNSLQEGREWRDYALELEKRAKTLCDVAEGLSSPEYEPAFRASLKLDVRRAVMALRELLPKETA